MASNESNFLDETHGSYYQSLVRLLFSKLGSFHEAEEVAQESFLRLHRAEAIESPSHARAFVFKVARNLAIDAGRRKLVERRSIVRGVSDSDSSKLSTNCQALNQQPSHEEIFDSRRRLDELRRAILSLPERQREVFILHKIHGISHKAIAEQLGITTHAVEKHIMRALALCRAAVLELDQKD